MKLKLTFPLFLTLVTLLWVLFLIYAANIYYKVHNRPVIYELLVCAAIFQLTVISFCYNWYRYKMPKFLDWFRLSTFAFLIWNYLKIADKMDEKVGIYGENYINTAYVYDSLLTVLIGIIAVSLVDKIFQIALFNKMNYSFQLKKDVFFRNIKVFYTVSLAFLFLEIFLVLTGVIGYGADDDGTTSGISFILQFINSISTLFLSSYAIFKYLYNIKDKTFNRIFILYVIGYFGYGILSGMKGTIYFGIIIVLVPFFLSGRSIPIKWLFVIALPLMLLYPLNSNFRNTLVNFPQLTKTQALGYAFTQTFSLDFKENLKDSGKSYGDRFSMFPYLLYAVEHESKWTNYKNMDRYVYLPVSFVPRFLIPSKPIQDNGKLLQKMIMNNENNSITPTSFGWAYFEGGNIFVFLTFVLLGIATSVFQYLVPKTSIFVLMFSINFIIQLLGMENDIYFLLAAVLQNLITYYIFYKLFFKKVR